MKEPGEYYDPQLDVRRHFTEEEVDTILLKELEEFELLADKIDETPLVYHGESIYNHPTQDIQLYPRVMGNVLGELSIMFDAPIIYLLDLRIPWLHQQNDFKPVANALNYL